MSFPCWHDMERPVIQYAEQRPPWTARWVGTAALEHDVTMWYYNILRVESRRARVKGFMILKPAMKQNLLEPYLRFLRAQARLRLELREAGNSDMNDLKRRREVAIKIACDGIAPCHPPSDLQESEKSKEETGDLWHQMTSTYHRRFQPQLLRRLGSWCVWAAICLTGLLVHAVYTCGGAALCTLKCNMLRTIWDHLFNGEGARDLNAGIKLF